MKMLRYLTNAAHLYNSKVRARINTEILRSTVPNLGIGRQTTIRYDTLKALSIGSNVSIGSFAEIVVIAHSPYSSVGGGLKIGANTVIGSFANIRAAGGEIEIGENVLLAQFVTIVAANHAVMPDHTYVDSGYDEARTGVRLGSNVWIGAGASLMPGTSIGDNSVIAAGAVVTNAVPANEVWAGVPARRLRAINHPLSGGALSGNRLRREAGPASDRKASEAEHL